jgi:multiple sugar transport system substrate-binding protein
MKTALKRVTLPLALLAATALTASCGSGSGGSSSKSVTVWMYPVIADTKANAAYWKKTDKDFEKAEPGTKLNIVQQPWANRDEKLATAFAGGKGPDVVLLIPDQIPQFVANGAIQPVDDAMKNVKGKLRAPVLKALTMDDKLYAAPIYQTVTSTLYNKKLLAKAGIEKPPATWDEVRAAAPKLKKAGYATLDYSAGNEATLNLNFYPLLWQAGGHVFSPDGKKAAFNSPAGVQALTFLTDLYKQGAVPKSALTAKNVVADQPLGKQQVAMGFSLGPQDVAVAEQAWGKGNAIVGEPLKDKKSVAAGIPGGLGMSAKAGDKEGAEKFLRFMAQPAQLKSLNVITGFSSPRTDVTVPSEDPHAKEFQTALERTNASEPNPVARQLMGILAPEIQASLTGKKSPEEALDSAAKQANDQLARQR